MEQYVKAVCTNCKTEVKIPLSDIKPGKKILCPKCNLAFSHLNKIIQDAERMQNNE
jgi:DNA-directed RNA polymerase subunit RPC12/RpoP